MCIFIILCKIDVTKSEPTRWLFLSIFIRKKIEKSMGIIETKLNKPKNDQFQTSLVLEISQQVELQVYYPWKVYDPLCCYSYLTTFLLRILTEKTHPKINLKHLKKYINMDIWIVGTLNQLFMRGSFQKNKAVSDKTPFVRSILYSPFYLSY